MKPTTKLFALLLCVLPLTLHAQTPAPPPTFHLSKCSVVWIYTGYFMQLFGTLNGQKVELQSDGRVSFSLGAHPTLLEPGDYPIVSTEEKKEDGGVCRTYELQLPDGKHAKYNLFGLSE